MKRCSKCQQLLSEYAFHRDRHNPDGLHSYCRTCRSVKTGRPPRKPENVVRQNDASASDADLRRLRLDGWQTTVPSHWNGSAHRIDWPRPLFTAWQHEALGFLWYDDGKWYTARRVYLDGGELRIIGKSKAFDRIPDALAGLERRRVA